MPLFEVKAGELVPFRRLKGGADLYESEIETLMWDNLDDFVGETLFRVTRQAKLPTGGIPDIVALDGSGRVVVFEIKRDVDRRQLAQCLEYAGWARTTSLDQLAGFYFGGEEAFWVDWQEFTGSTTPVIINRKPRIVLVAHDFLDRTKSAFDFLSESGVPIEFVPISIYEDGQGRKLVDVQSDYEPDFVEADDKSDGPHWMIAGRRVRMDDLLDAELLVAGDTLTWDRPRLGERYTAKVLETGAIELDDGRVVSSPSRAAVLAANEQMPNGDLQTFDGWMAWMVDRTGKTLDELRREL